MCYKLCCNGIVLGKRPVNSHAQAASPARVFCRVLSSEIVRCAARTAWIYLGSTLSGQLMRTGLDHVSHISETEETAPRQQDGIRKVKIKNEAHGLRKGGL